VLVDADALVDDASASWSPQRLLGGLLHHPNIQAIRYGDNRPPPDGPVHEVPFGTPKAIGWLTPTDPSGTGTTGFWYSEGDGPIYTGYPSQATDWVATTVTDEYQDLPETEAARRRHRDAVAMAVARTIKPDLFITHRRHLMDSTFRHRGLTIGDVSGGLALLGLYLRSQGCFSIWADADGSFPVDLGRDMFFWIGARELLPEAWRWINACSQHVRGNRTKACSISPCRHRSA
jgi:hypothetical protein